MPTIAVFAPATVSNVASGFDVLGFALEQPGDIVVARLAERSGRRDRRASTGDGGRLSRDPAPEHRRRRGGGAAGGRSARARASCSTVHKGLPLASGVGSSGASAVAAAVAVNELLGRPALGSPARLRDAGRAGRLRRRPSRQRRAVALRRFRAGAQRAAARYRAAAGAVGLSCAVLHPHSKSRPARRGPCSATRCRCRTAVRQWANLGALVSALHTRRFRAAVARARGPRGRAETGGARARLRRASRPRPSTPVRSAAACRARARRSSRWPVAVAQARAVGHAMRRRATTRNRRPRRGPLDLGRRHAGARVVRPLSAPRDAVHQHARRRRPAGRRSRGAVRRASRPMAACTCHATSSRDRRRSSRAAARPVARRGRHRPDRRRSSERVFDGPRLAGCWREALDFPVPLVPVASGRSCARALPRPDPGLQGRRRAHDGRWLMVVAATGDARR